MRHDHDRSAWRKAIQAHTRATEAYIQAVKATTRALAGSRIDDLPGCLQTEAVWSDLTRQCCYCGSTFGVILVQAAVPATTHGVCDACLAVEMAKLQHPVTNGRA